MPSKQCANPRCGNLVVAPERYCSKCQGYEKAIKKSYEKRDPKIRSMYDRRWRKYRLQFLARNPFCVRCLDEGLYREADVVDHIEPHKGNYAKFWDTSNHQALCKRHHDIKTATEDGGFGKRTNGNE